MQPSLSQPEASSTSVLTGGAAVVAHLLGTRLGRTLPPAQAQAIWARCRQHLEAQELFDTLADCEQSLDGRLDTLEREDVLDALGHTLVGQAWPINADSPGMRERFGRQLKRRLGIRD